MPARHRALHHVAVRVTRLRVVTRFFEERHRDRYFIYNFCCETGREYDPAIFGGRVQVIPFQDHCVPTPQMMYAPSPVCWVEPARAHVRVGVWGCTGLGVGACVFARVDFCESASRWLAAHPDNVVGVHCKAGKGRSGMMACNLMLKLGIARDAAEAIEYYGAVRAASRVCACGCPCDAGHGGIASRCVVQHRVANKKGLTVPSQKRYVGYYQEVLRRNALGIQLEGSCLCSVR